MTVSLNKLAMAISLVGAILALTACQSRPGYNAYGRYQNSSATTPSNSATSDTDWFKDIGN
jgi:hypothetical protein